MEKKIIALLFLFLFLPNINAQDLEIEIEPRYYYYSEEVLVYNNSTIFTGISFDIYGKNLNDFHRLLNITIIDSSSELKGKFSNDYQNLRISEKKLLFSSKIIDINKFNELNFTIFVGISAIDEETLLEIYSEDKFNFLINKPKEMEKPFFERLGDTMWEGNYNGGLFILFLSVFGIIFLFWYFKFGEKSNKWRNIREIKRTK